MTLTDPTTWTQPWTAMMPDAAAAGSSYEFACHEGNYHIMSGMLVGAQKQDWPPGVGSPGCRVQGHENKGSVIKRQEGTIDIRTIEARHFAHVFGQKDADDGKPSSGGRQQIEQTNE